MSDNNLIKLRDGFREVADIIDEMIEIEKREEEGQDVAEEMERVIGRYMMKCLELNSLNNG